MTPPTGAVPSAHRLLGVAPSATPAEIRRAFRRRAFDLHPDRNPAPHAADDFCALRAAYETLTGTVGEVADGFESEDRFDVEAIARDIEAAARRADRRRPGVEPARTWQPIRVPLDRSAADRLRGGLATPRGRTSIGLAFVVGALLGAGVPVAAGFVGWSWAAAGLGLAGSLLAGARAVWTADPRPWAVDIHWRGVRDVRWDATVEWAEIREVRESERWLDLVLTEAAARRLGRSVPPTTLIGRPEGEAVYRLPLRASAGLAGAVREQLAALTT